MHTVNHLQDCPRCPNCMITTATFFDRKPCRIEKQLCPYCGYASYFEVLPSENLQQIFNYCHQGFEVQPGTSHDHVGLLKEFDTQGVRVLTRTDGRIEVSGILLDCDMQDVLLFVKNLANDARYDARQCFISHWDKQKTRIQALRRLYGALPECLTYCPQYWKENEELLTAQHPEDVLHQIVEIPQECHDVVNYRRENGCSDDDIVCWEEPIITGEPSPAFFGIYTEEEYKLRDMVDNDIPF